MPSFIADGYTFSARINPIEGIHDGVEIKYRAMTPTDSAEYVHEAEHANGQVLRNLQVKWLMKKVVGWQSVKSENGQREKIPQLNYDIVSGEPGKPFINTTLFSQLCDVVIWGSKPDVVLDGLDEESVKN